MLPLFRHLSVLVLLFSALVSPPLARAQTAEILAAAAAVPSKPTRFDGVQIRSEHPRIWIDTKKLAWLKDKYKGKTSDEVAAEAGPAMLDWALTYAITGDAKWCRMAIAAAKGQHVDPGSKLFDLNTPDGVQKRSAVQPSLADRALVYDWCYPLLGAADKAELQAVMVPAMKKTMAQPRFWRSFHNALYDQAWPLTVAILALHGDVPDTVPAWAFLKPELEDVMKTMDLVFPDGEWAEGYDYNRHSTYPAMRIFLAIKTATGFDAIKDSPHFRNTAKYIMYGAKPNGLALPADDNDWPYLATWEHAMLLMLNEEYRDPYTQAFINSKPAPRFELEPYQRYAKVLWYDPAIAEKPLADLPLARIFRGRDLVMARSAWTFDKPGQRANAAWLSFHSGPYMGDHTHRDINSFTLTYKGELALDAGRYDDHWGIEDTARNGGDPDLIKQSQFFNHYRRTIAHNTLLVMDPSEKVPMRLANDGGQIDYLRRHVVRNVPEDYDQGNYPSEEGVAVHDWVNRGYKWDGGVITAYRANKDYLYIRSDGTKAYERDKMRHFVRELVYVQPDVVVVMDRVVSTDPSFKKTWLLHTVNEPQPAAGGKALAATHEDGRLVLVPVLPAKAQVANVGGPGKEFQVGGNQYKTGMQTPIRPSELHYGEIPGAWRVEVSPAKAANEDHFLHVMQMTDATSTEVPKVKVLRDDPKHVTVQISTRDGKVATLDFSKGEQPGAHIRLVKQGKLSVQAAMPTSVELEAGRDR